MDDDLQEIAARARMGSITPTDIQTLITAAQRGRLTQGTSSRGVAIGGGVHESLVLTGDNNLIIVLTGEAAKILQSVLQNSGTDAQSSRDGAALIKLPMAITPESMETSLRQIGDELKQTVKLFNSRLRPNSIIITQTYTNLIKIRDSVSHAQKSIHQLDLRETAMIVQMLMADQREGIFARLSQIGTELLQLDTTTGEVPVSQGGSVQKIRDALLEVETSLQRLISEISPE